MRHKKACRPGSSFLGSVTHSDTHSSQCRPQLVCMCVCVFVCVRICSVRFAHSLAGWHLFSHVKMFAYTCSNMSSRVLPLNLHFSPSETASWSKEVSLLGHMCVCCASSPCCDIHRYLFLSYLCFIKSKAYYFLEIVSPALCRHTFTFIFFKQHPFCLHVTFPPHIFGD